MVMLEEYYHYVSKLVNAKRSKCQASKVIWGYVNLKDRLYSKGDGKTNYREGKSN